MSSASLEGAASPAQPLRSIPRSWHLSWIIRLSRVRIWASCRHEEGAFPEDADPGPQRSNLRITAAGARDTFSHQPLSRRRPHTGCDAQSSGQGLDSTLMPGSPALQTHRWLSSLFFRPVHGKTQRTMAPFFLVLLWTEFLTTP